MVTHHPYAFRYPSEELKLLELKLMRLRWFRYAKRYSFGEDPEPLIPESDIPKVDKQIEVVLQKIRDINLYIEKFGDNIGEWE